MNDANFLMRYAMTAEQKADAIECACKRFPITDRTKISIMTIPQPPKEDVCGGARASETVDVYVVGDYRIAYFDGLDKLFIGLKSHE